MLSLLLAATLLGPPPPSQGFEALEGFNTVVVSHVNRVLGTEKLPAAQGNPVEPGMFVTMTPARVMAYDVNVATLEAGRSSGGPAKECRSGCAAMLYDGFARVWLELAVEAAGLNVEITPRVLLAADATMPAQTLVEVAYAAGETRPIQPPSYFLLVNGRNAGLRAQPFHMLPPGGLRTAPGTRPLGLTVAFGGGSFAVASVDPRFRQQVKAGSLKELDAVLKDVKKNYPNKDIIVLRPNDRATVGELLDVMVSTRNRFPYPVLAGNQEISVR